VANRKNKVPTMTELRDLVEAAFGEFDTDDIGLGKVVEVGRPTAWVAQCVRGENDIIFVTAPTRGLALRKLAGALKGIAEVRGG
jgi:hypothetical protein